MSDAASHVAAEALRLLGPFPENWVPARPEIDHDVVIVGGGHTGSTFAFALSRAGIRNFSVIDAASDEASSGVWLTRARMNLLRTPKNLAGPELGLQRPELSGLVRSASRAKGLRRSRPNPAH
jgi:FAD-dependent urate hydroxylase